MKSAITMPTKGNRERGREGEREREREIERERERERKTGYAPFAVHERE